MAVALSIASAFDRFAREGAIVGRLVVEYGELEWALCLAAGAAANDRGAALRAMYRAGNGAQRIVAGDALVRTHLRDAALSAIHAATIERLRDCLRIRDRYAQTSWTIEGDSHLALVDIDAALTRDDRAGGEVPALRRVTIGLLEDQQRLFAEVMQNLTYLHWDLEALNGGPRVGNHYIVPIAPADDRD